MPTQPLKFGDATAAFGLPSLAELCFSGERWESAAKTASALTVSCGSLVNRGLFFDFFDVKQKGTVLEHGNKDHPAYRIAQQDHN